MSILTIIGIILTVIGGIMYLLTQKKDDVIKIEYQIFHDDILDKIGIRKILSYRSGKKTVFYWKKYTDLSLENRYVKKYSYKKDTWTNNVEYRRLIYNNLEGRKNLKNLIEDISNKDVNPDFFKVIDNKQYVIKELEKDKNDDEELYELGKMLIKNNVPIELPK